MRRLLIGLLFLLLAAPGWAQKPIVYTPPHVYPFMTCTSTACTSTVPILLPDGTAAARAIAFASESDLGLYRSSNNILCLGSSSTENILCTEPLDATLKVVGLSFGTQGALIGNSDLYLRRDGAANLQLGIDAATATAQTLAAADSTGTDITGASLTVMGGDGTAGNAQGGALILRGGNNAGTGEEGTVQISDTGTKPTCAAGIRGSVWYDAGGAGVADTFEVCAKSAADAYAWYALATIP